MENIIDEYGSIMSAIPVVTGFIYVLTKILAIVTV